MQKRYIQAIGGLTLFLQKLTFAFIWKPQLQTLSHKTQLIKQYFRITCKITQVCGNFAVSQGINATTLS